MKLFCHSWLRQQTPITTLKCLFRSTEPEKDYYPLNIFFLFTNPYFFLRALNAEMVEAVALIGIYNNLGLCTSGKQHAFVSFHHILP